MIIQTVKEQDGHADVRRSFQSGVALRIKAAVEPCTQSHKEIAQPGRQLHFAYDMLNDLFCGGEAAVSQHTDDIWRQGFAGGHQYRGRAHGNACK